MASLQKYAVKKALPTSKRLGINFQTKLGISELLKVGWIGGHPLNRCYWSVADKVTQEGGRALHGWKFSLRGKDFIEVVHHAVWETPEGDLLCVSDKHPDYVDNHITFAIGSTVEITDEFGPMYETIFISPSPNLGALKDIHTQRMGLTRKIAIGTSHQTAMKELGRLNYLEHDAMKACFGNSTR